jgi:hypothetical protein
VLTALFALFALFALAWRFEPTMVVVLFGVLRSVLAMVGVVARVVIVPLFGWTLNFNCTHFLGGRGRYPFIVKI